MAVSPSDFELYSRVTGRPVPTDRGARMKMAPEVNRFIKNREYERPQKTAFQKGADLLGKAAIIGGALAAGHAIGGGFRGKTAENVGKVADVVQNLAKTGDVGAEGGKVVQNVAKAATGMATYPNEMYGALQQEEMLNNLAQPAVDVQTSVADRSTALADRILNRPGGDLDRLDNFVVDIPPNTGGGDTILPKKPDVSAQIESVTEEQVPLNAFGVPYKEWDPITKTVKGEKVIVRPGWSEEQKQAQAEKIYGEKLTKAERVPLHRQYATIQSDQNQPDYPAEGSTQEAVDNFLRNRYNQATEESLRAIPGISDSTDVAMKEGVPGWRVPPGKPIYEKTKQLQAPFPPVQPLPLNDRGLDSGGGALVPSSPQPTEIVATTPESSEVVSNEGGLRQRVEDFGNRAEQHVKDWWHLDNEKLMGDLGKALNQDPTIPIPIIGRAAETAGVLGPALAKQGLINTGQTAKALYGYGKSAYEKAQDIYLKSQIDRASMGVGGGKLVAPNFSVSGSPLSYVLQDQIDQGWSRHDAAIAPLAKNLQAAFGITLPTGQVAIGEDHQLNDHPDIGLGETDMAPSRNRAENDRRSDWKNVSLNQYNKYASFKDKDILGEGSLTPDDIEIRTDIDVDDPVLSKSLYGRRVGRGEKQKFITGLKARNEDVYSGEGTSGMRRGTSSDYETHFGSDVHIPKEDVVNALRQKYLDASLLKGYKRGQEARLPARKEGTGFTLEGKRGTGSSVGELGSLSGVINFNSPDDRPKNPIQAGFDALTEGIQTGAQKEAAEKVGKKMAEREQQGNLFEDNEEQQQGSTEWVRSPDGKLRRVQIDDPW